MIDEIHEELAALGALDLLETEEKARFVAELKSNPEMKALASGLRETAALAVAFAPRQAEPPAELKSRILASAAARGAERSPPRRLISFPALLPWLAAACFAVVAAWAAQLYLKGRSESGLIRDQERLAELELQSTRNQLEAERILSQREIADGEKLVANAVQEAADSNRQVTDLTAKLKAQGDLARFKIATLASMLGNSPQALAVAVWDPSSQEGVFTVSKLPAAATGKDYQLWVIDPEYKAPVNAGVFKVDRSTGATRVDFKAVRPIRAISKFAVSIEREGGASEPQGPIVMLSE